MVGPDWLTGLPTLTDVKPDQIVWVFFFFSAVSVKCDICSVQSERPIPGSLFHKI